MARKFSGKRLRQCRVAKAATIEQMALDLGKSYLTLRSYEAGTTTPPGQMIGQLADLLGCSTEDFYEQDEAVAA